MGIHRGNDVVRVPCNDRTVGEEGQRGGGGKRGSAGVGLGAMQEMKQGLERRTVMIRTGIRNFKL